MDWITCLRCSPPRTTTTTGRASASYFYDKLAAAAAEFLSSRGNLPSVEKCPQNANMIMISIISPGRRGPFGGKAATSAAPGIDLLFNPMSKIR